MSAVSRNTFTRSRTRNLALPILLLAFGLLALLARPALARESEWTVECISDQHGSNSNAYLSGGRVLHSHTSIQSSVVVDSPLLYDIATRQTVPLTDPTTDYIAGMGISGDRVVWGRHTLPHGATWEVMLHQVTAGSTGSITQGAPYQAAHPSIGGNLVVHLAWMTAGGGQDIFVQDLETGTVRNVTGSGFSLRGIFRALDLAGGSVRVISTGACGSAATDGNMIAWSEWDPEVGVGRMADGTTQAKESGRPLGLSRWAARSPPSPSPPVPARPRADTSHDSAFRTSRAALRRSIPPA